MEAPSKWIMGLLFFAALAAQAADGPLPPMDGAPPARTDFPGGFPGGPRGGVPGGGLSLDEAKELIHDFGGRIDKKARQALLVGQVAQACAQHLKVTADEKPSSQGMYAFTLLDKDGKGVACLREHQKESCDDSHPCVSLQELGTAQVAVESALLEKAQVGLHARAVVSLTEASATCDCTATLPGPAQDLPKAGLPSSQLKSVLDELALNEDKVDDKKPAPQRAPARHPSRDSSRPAKSGDGDKNNSTSDASDRQLDQTLLSLLMSRQQGQTGGMPMMGNSLMGNSMMTMNPMGSYGLSYGMNPMSSMMGSYGMNGLYGMNTMGGLGMMNGMGMNGTGVSSNIMSYYLMMNSYNSMWMNMMARNAMYSRLSYGAIPSLGVSSLYGGSITGGTLGSSALGTTGGIYGGSITGGR